jgi:hypothetical protein
MAFHFQKPAGFGCSPPPSAGLTLRTLGKHSILCTNQSLLGRDITTTCIARRPAGSPYSSPATYSHAALSEEPTASTFLL